MERTMSIKRNYVIKDNFNEITLTLGKDVIMDVENVKTIAIHIPTISELYTSQYDRSIFLTVMITSLDEIRQHYPGLYFESKVEFIIQVLRERTDVSRILEHYFQVLTHNTFRYTEELNLLSFDGLVVNDQVLDCIGEYLKVGLGYKTLQEYISDHANDNVKKTEEELEWERRERENQQRIAKLKAEKGEGHQMSIEKILYLISYTFGTSLEELGNKNFYTLNVMYADAMRIDAYHLNLIAEGNGLTGKNHKHIHWINMK